MYINFKSLTGLQKPTNSGLNEGMYVGQDATCRKQMDIVHMRIRNIIFQMVLDSALEEKLLKLKP